MKKLKKENINQSMKLKTYIQDIYFRFCFSKNINSIHNVNIVAFIYNNEDLI